MNLFGFVINRKNAKRKGKSKTAIPAPVKHKGRPKGKPRKMATETKVKIFKKTPPPVGESSTRRPRQNEVLHLMAKGLGNKQIADKMGIGENTVKNYVMDLCNEFDVQSRVDVLRMALKKGDLTMDDL